ncbi:MAG: type I restriction-modification enzyme R subunit C-terminal domain-containing protein [Planctomycetaceae bacterium]
METEAQTRRKRIDVCLRLAGWEITRWSSRLDIRSLERHAVEEFPTATGPADYALIVDGVLVGIVEAKKLSINPSGVLGQSERYSESIAEETLKNYNGFRIPFLYATNGELIRFHDIRDQLNLSRQIQKFHTPTALKELLGRNSWSRAWFSENPSVHQRLRDYQKGANSAVEDAIVSGRRKMLVAMATGTGKTFTTVNQAYRLLKSGTAKRILFLVDRRALAAQAVRAFSVFEPEPNKKFDKIFEVYSNRFQKEDFGDEEAFDPKVLPTEYLLNPQPKHTFVYVCTIQRMAISILGRQAVYTEDGDDADEDAQPLNIPIHAFDVIIADECHRGYTSAEQSIWRAVLDHFDAVKIGLTATPASHTKAYFHDVVFRYTYEQAVREGHLVDWDLVRIASNVRINGVFLKEGETVEHVDLQSGAKELDSLEDHREFAATELERVVTSPDSNRKILQELKKYADAHEAEHGRFPKTLIFAANDLPHASHADELAEMAREIFGRGEAFVRKITGRVDRPLQRIREFRNRPNPGIAITVDLLSTGVDIPDLEYIVFLRPVKSRILFEQMLGRGTRKGDKYPDKSHFTVFDCFNGTLVEYFKNATTMTSEPPSAPTRTIAEIINAIWDNNDREYNVRCLVKRLQRIDKQMAPEARDLFAAYGIANGDIGKYATQLPGRLKSDFSGTMMLVRKSDFQDLLENYPRRPRTFIRATENEDQVSSEFLIRDGQGKEHKQEDYLALFARFIRQNPAHIDAVQILLDRPAGWGTEALKELKQKLITAPERFTLDALQKAHQVRYQKSLVDIISMVKHAASAQNPLLTAEERAAKAVAHISRGRVFTAEQQQWLDRIEQHLAQNLSIDADDFDIIPSFEGAGGWGKANRVFEGNLELMLRQFNEALAA